MEADRILGVYERIAGLMARMVDAARAREWERLGHLELSCKACVAALRAADLDAPMPPDLQHRRTRLIGEVLRADAQIRELTEPWSAQLNRYLGAARIASQAPSER